MSVVDINHLIAHIQRTDPKLWLALKNIWEAALKEGSITEPQLNQTIINTINSSFSLKVNDSVIASPVNFNDDSPSTPFGYSQVFFQFSGSNVSAYSSLDPSFARRGALIGGVIDYTGANNDAIFGVEGAGINVSIALPIGGYLKNPYFYVIGTIAQGELLSLAIMTNITVTTGLTHGRVYNLLIAKPGDSGSVTNHVGRSEYRLELMEFLGTRKQSFGVGVNEINTWSAEFVPDEDVSLLASGFGATVPTIPAASTRYLSFFHGNHNINTWPETTEADAEWPVPCAGTIKKLSVVLSNAQPGTGSLVFTVRKNGAATGITVTVAAGAGSVNDRIWIDFSTSPVSVSTGDRICIEAVNNAPATASAPIRSVCLLFVPTTITSRIIGGHIDNIFGDATTNYSTPLVRSFSTTQANQEWPVPCAGRFRNLYVKVSAASGALNTLTLTLMVNGVASVVTGTVTATSSGVIALDTTNIQSVSAGAYISMRMVQSGAAGCRLASWSMEFEAPV